MSKYYAGGFTRAERKLNIETTEASDNWVIELPRVLIYSNI